MLIHHFLEESARRYPGKVAVIHEGVRATYGEIEAKANHLASWLIDQGVAGGDRVALILENCLEYIVSYYGVLKTGATVAPISNDIKPKGLIPLLQELEPKILIASGRHENVLKAVEYDQLRIRGLVLKKPKFEWPSAPFPIFFWDDLMGCPLSVVRGPSSSSPSAVGGQRSAVVDEPSAVSGRRSAVVSDIDLATIIYTSGSTGKPKGVMLSHRNIVSNTHSICNYLELTDKDIQMVVLPFFYVMGMSILNTHFAVGGTLVINNKFAFPGSVVKQMVEERVTGFSGVPSTYAYLLNRSPLEAYRDRFECLRYCSQAGGHMSRQIKENLRRVLPSHTKIYIMYGATEGSGRLTYLEPNRFAEKMDSIGKSIPNVEARILDKNGEEVPVGTMGELVVDGPNIMMGYWKDPEATAKALGKKGYHTGDLGYRDKEGYLYAVGRMDNLIKMGGHKINPQEIEDAIMESGLAMEALVLAISDKLLGQKIVALVTPKAKGCTESEVMSFCARAVPKYKLPAGIKLVSGLPKSSSGKVDKLRCQELIEKAF
jgi:acyl-CoA synthetase (AMP-forming)/AMP-acid ligase II